MNRSVVGTAREVGAMRTSNPVFGNRFERYMRDSLGSQQTESMTLEGTITKTGILLLLLLISATVVWYFFGVGNYGLVLSLMIVGILGGLVVGLITAFKPRWASTTAPAYAILEGLILGGLSALFEAVYPGILLQAVGLTFGVFALMLLLYRVRILRATPLFVKGIVAATGAIMVIYLVGLILTLFGIPVFFWSSSSPISIAFSVFVVAIAALNFVL
ncbi:MAG TPA: Bax inhibitor-1/YccA family protein, partial [Thermoplasmata archaeon]|nr:Bax inhibitor-1/YccA family protein [Thermoplasmata archaeon]